MFERFIERARRVVVLAHEEARMFQHGDIGKETPSRATVGARAMRPSAVVSGRRGSVHRVQRYAERCFKDMVFSVCADLRACADWRALADELLVGEEPRTVVGIEHRQWLAARSG